VEATDANAVPLFAVGRLIDQSCRTTPPCSGEAIVVQSCRATAPCSGEVIVIMRDHCLASRLHRVRLRSFSVGNTRRIQGTATTCTKSHQAKVTASSTMKTCRSCLRLSCRPKHFDESRARCKSTPTWALHCSSSLSCFAQPHLNCLHWGSKERRATSRNHIPNHATDGETRYHDGNDCRARGATRRLGEQAAPAVLLQSRSDSNIRINTIQKWCVSRAKRY